MPRELAPATLAERAVLLKHPARSAPPPAPRCAPLAGRTTSDYVDIGGTQLFIRFEKIEKSPLLVLHHPPGSSALYDDLVLEAGNAIAVDLPGHGESDPLPGNPQDPASLARAVSTLLDRLKIDDVRIYAHNGAAAVALELGKRASSIVLDAPSFLQDQSIATRYAPPVEPVWDGSHWLRAWNHLRDSELWWPWFERRHENVSKGGHRIDPQALTIRVREAMKQPGSYGPAWQAALSYPWRERIKGLEKKIRTIAAPQDVFAHLSPDAIRVEDNARSKAQAIR
jgi:pimeloyl-ACP methyl ester carboxylesterase